VLIGPGLGHSGSWVVKDNLFVGYIVAVREVLPIIYMIPASSVLESISQQLDEFHVSLSDEGVAGSMRELSHDFRSGLVVNDNASSSSPKHRADIRRSGPSREKKRLSFTKSYLPDTMGPSQPPPTDEDLITRLPDVTPAGETNSTKPTIEDPLITDEKTNLPVPPPAPSNPETLDPFVVSISCSSHCDHNRLINCLSCR
jgi:hypothetical protein